METRSHWRFREMRAGEMNVDPIEGEFFTTEALRSITDALVREAVQNSLDAAAGTEPVTVRLSLHPRPAAEADRRGAERGDPYLDGLAPHLSARHSGLPETPPFGELAAFLSIEDYGTRGLQGDERQYDDLGDDLRKNDFFYFWRNIGRTRKEQADLGRWGLGKTVFQAASRINTFFGLTVRRDDGRTLLMGQSVLKIHKVGAARFAPYGYYGIHSGELALPIEDSMAIDLFSQHFLLDRSGKPGLSVVIPYPDREIDLKGCASAAVRHYFFPILAGRLVVELRFDGKRVRLDAASLGDCLQKIQSENEKGLPGLIRLARWALRQPAASHIGLRLPPVGKRPKLTAELMAPRDLEAARTEFNAGRRLAIHVPVAVLRPSGEKVVRTGFTVFLERDERLERPEDHFIRQGITIPEVHSLKHKGIRAIVSISESGLSAFLGDAENPAHTQWERNSKKFKSQYKLGPATLDYVKTSPREIVKILTQPTQGRDETLLSHVFALPLESASGDGGRPGAEPAPGREAHPAEEAGVGDHETGAYLQLGAIRGGGGFRLRRRPNALQVPRFITIRVAYEVRGGNPFKKYAPFDFDLGAEPIRVEAEGARVTVCRESEIQIEVYHGDFRLTVTGFDTQRDLRVWTRP